MKALIWIGLVLVLFTSSCGPSKEEIEARQKCRQDELDLKTAITKNLKATFDSPFPKRNRDLSKILGDTLQLEGWCIGSDFKIVSNRKLNYIINIDTRDTLFKGTVCKYKDLYYLSEQVNDTAFRIFALKVTDSLIYGFRNYIQYFKIDSAVGHGKYPKLVKYVDSNKNIRLHPNKKELRKLFTYIMLDTDPCYIVHPSANIKVKEEEPVSANIETEDFETLSKVYPNPASDIVNVDLYEKNKATPYYVSDMNGKIVLHGQFNEISNKIDLSQLANGNYNLSLVTPEKQTETLKIIKIK